MPLPIQSPGLYSVVMFPQSCLLEGKAFVRRFTQDGIENDATTRAFQTAIRLGSVEQDTASSLSFFTLRFYDGYVESRVSTEYYCRR